MKKHHQCQFNHCGDRVCPATALSVTMVVCRIGVSQCVCEWRLHRWQTRGAFRRCPCWGASVQTFDGLCLTAVWIAVWLSLRGCHTCTRLSPRSLDVLSFMTPRCVCISVLEMTSNPIPRLESIAARLFFWFAHSWTKVYSYSQWAVRQRL